MGAQCRLVGVPTRKSALNVSLAGVARRPASIVIEQACGSVPWPEYRQEVVFLMAMKKKARLATLIGLTILAVLALAVEPANAGRRRAACGRRAGTRIGAILKLPLRAVRAPFLGQHNGRHCGPPSARGACGGCP